MAYFACHDVAGVAEERRREQQQGQRAYPEGDRSNGGLARVTYGEGASGVSLQFLQATAVGGGSKGGGGGGGGDSPAGALQQRSNSSSSATVTAAQLRPVGPPLDQPLASSSSLGAAAAAPPGSGEGLVAARSVSSLGAGNGLRASPGEGLLPLTASPHAHRHLRNHSGGGGGSPSAWLLHPRALWAKQVELIQPARWHRDNKEAAADNHQQQQQLQLRGPSGEQHLPQPQHGAPDPHQAKAYDNLVAFVNPLRVGGARGLGARAGMGGWRRGLSCMRHPYGRPPPHPPCTASSPLSLLPARPARPHSTHTLT